MGFGTSEWGDFPWGDGAGAAELALSSVEILAKDTLLVSFTEPLSKSSANYAVGNYDIANLTVRSIIKPDDEQAPTDLILVVDRLSVGQSYTISADGLEAASGNIFNSGITITFSGRRTKLDKVLTSTPTMYDTSPEATIRQIMVAIHREDDHIGGSKEE